MKKILIAIAFCCFNVLLFAGIKDVGFKVFKEKQDYGKNSSIGLEIVNKTKQDIWVALRNGDTIFLKVENGKSKNVFKIGSKKGEKSRQFEIDIKLPTEVAVWYADPGKVEIKTTRLWERIGREAFSPQPEKVYFFTKGKTIFINWKKKEKEEQRSFFPERGPLKGLLKKTDSGLNLGNNVTLDDIREAGPRGWETILYSTPTKKS